VAKTSTEIGTITQSEGPVAASALSPGTPYLLAWSGHGTTYEPAGATMYLLHQPVSGYLVRVPRTQHTVVLRVNTTRLREQEEIERANDYIQRFGRIFFY